MRAAEAVLAARSHGVEIILRDEHLVLTAAAPPPAAVLEALADQKPAIIALLRQEEDGWTAEDWRVFYDERAAIGEVDGGLPRPEADAVAYAACIAEWLERWRGRWPTAGCHACRSAGGGGDHPPPSAGDDSGPASRAGCSPSGACAPCEALAAAALTRMGLEQRKGLP